MAITSPVLGLRPVRAARCRASYVPKPPIETFSPASSALAITPVIGLNRWSMASAAAAWVRPDCDASCLANSVLFTSVSSSFHGMGSELRVSRTDPYGTSVVQPLSAGVCSSWSRTVGARSTVVRAPPQPITPPAQAHNIITWMRAPRAARVRPGGPPQGGNLVDVTGESSMLCAESGARAP